MWFETELQFSSHSMALAWTLIINKIIETINAFLACLDLSARILRLSGLLLQHRIQFFSLSLQCIYSYFLTTQCSLFRQNVCTYIHACVSTKPVSNQYAISANCYCQMSNCCTAVSVLLLLHFTTAVYTCSRAVIAL